MAFTALRLDLRRQGASAGARISAVAHAVVHAYIVRAPRRVADGGHPGGRRTPRQALRCYSGEYISGPPWVYAGHKFQIWSLDPWCVKFNTRVPGGVVRAGASAEAAQSTPLWATLSPGPKKAPYVCCYRAWGTLNYQNMPKYYLYVCLCVYLYVCLCIYKYLCK